MKNIKCIYVDIYKPNFTDDGITVENVKHLKKIDLYTDVTVREIVFKLRQLIFEKYNDGLYIKAEEFDSFCYLNIFVFFGEDIGSLLEYLKTVSLQNVVSKEENSLIEVDDEKTFFSIDYVNSDEIKEYSLLIESLGLDPNLYLLGQSAFERGAGDYHQVIIFILDSLAVGALNEIGKRSLEKLVKQFREHQSASIIKFNPNTAIDYTSSISGINKQDLRVTKFSPLNDNKTEVKITSRYKDFILIFDNKSNSFVNYEEIDKTQTMI